MKTEISESKSGNIFLYLKLSIQLYMYMPYFL